MGCVSSRAKRALAAPCRLDRGDVDLLHSHHRVERALGGRLITTGDRF